MKEPPPMKRMERGSQKATFAAGGPLSFAALLMEKPAALRRLPL